MKQAAHFDTAADRHEMLAKRWLLAVAFAAVALVAYAFYLAGPQSSTHEGMTTGDAVNLIFARLVAIAAGTSVLIMCVRSYMANKHNEIVNRHRSNSLSTYRALVEASGDPATRDLVLSKAAETIFAPQPTGFTRHDPDDGKAMSMVSVGAAALRSSQGNG